MRYLYLRVEISVLRPSTTVLQIQLPSKLIEETVRRYFRDCSRCRSEIERLGTTDIEYDVYSYVGVNAEGEENSFGLLE